MACTQARSHELAELSAGRLSGDAMEELLEHVGTCDACSAELDLVADLVAAPAPAATSTPDVRPQWIPWAAAAALVFALGLGFLQQQDPSAGLAELKPLPAWTGVLRGDDDPSWREAMEQYERGEYEQAARSLRAIVDEKPRALAQLYLGIALAQTEAWSEAVLPLEAALQGDGLVRGRAQWFLAQVRLARGERDEAIELLKQIVSEDEDYAPNAEAQLLELE